MSKTEALKRYFSTAERPVTAKELTDLRKQDPLGYEELAGAALQALGATE